MQDYKIVTLKNTASNNEILIALLNDLNFDSFEETSENEIKAYILKSDFDEAVLTETLNALPIFNNLEIEVSDLENRNWNEEWEQNFKPIVIEDKCVVRAPFHKEHNADFELVIEPKMAFGTGHHATTEMMLKLMLGMDFELKEVLDFGCGTGILSLLAEKKGAKNIDANDIEEPAYINTIENLKLNNCKLINAFHGNINILPSKKYNIILANVTTLTIKENYNQLIEKLEDGGEILFSGILESQKDEVKELAKDLKFVNELHQDKWIALHYIKN